MEDFDLIDVPDGYLFQVTWDLGRRCNYDCSYCGDLRHNNWSPHASLEDLQSTADFVLEYCDEYLKHRVLKVININFNGGEPTVNKNFVNLLKYIKDQQHKHDYEIKLSLTTNGAFSKKLLNEMHTLMDQVTISYHCEASDILKKSVRDRIFEWHDLGMDMMVNVMMHSNDTYFNECQELCYSLKDNNIRYIPRVIGDDEDTNKDTTHRYSDTQISWLRNHWAENKKQLTSNEGRNKDHCTGAVGPSHRNEKNKLGIDEGRPCCGSRLMCTANKQKRELTKFINKTNFKDWYCSINWFFLHINQEANLVFHHQTCKAKFGKKAGPIGKLRHKDKIISELREKLETGTLDLIQCPNTFCGCGICTPKSSNKEKLVNELQKHFSIEVLNVRD